MENKDKTEKKKKRWEEVKEGKFPIEAFRADLNIERAIHNLEKNKERKEKTDSIDIL